MNFRRLASQGHKLKSGIRGSEKANQPGMLQLTGVFFFQLADEIDIHIAIFRCCGIGFFRILDLGSRIPNLYF
jgi:hypothetical protein